MYSLTILTLALLAGALAGPISYQTNDRTTCAQRCTDGNKFNYVPGKIYEFTYNVQSQTAMEGASTERAALAIRATADIEVVSKCDMILMLRDVSISRSDPIASSMKYVDDSGEFRRLLERYPLRFAFQDGVVEELCPAEGENTWALNIKRGVLTTLQNSMESFDKNQKMKEVDVNGECNTEYNVTKGWLTTTIKKTKDLLGCTDRIGFQSSVHAMQYRAPSEIQSLPLMKSTHECAQEVDRNRIMKSATIMEKHIFRPFSQANSGAMTNIIQRLNFVSARAVVNPRREQIRNRVGMKFQHMYGSGNREEPIRDMESKLTEICENTREDIRPETPRMFSELVYIMKNMDVASIQSVYRTVNRASLCTGNNDRVRKFFLDAIPMASTSDSIEFMKELLVNREVIDTMAQIWIASLSLVHRPTRQMMQSVKFILDMPQYSKSAMLPISTMVNNYCSHQACSDDVAITRIVTAIEKVLGYGCYIRDSNLEASLVALRALGNAGHIVAMASTISSCFKKQENPIEVRVSAIQAFRRLPCTADRRDVLSIYENADEDSEVRVAAYLAVMQCPTQIILNRIQETLARESANQVGSFVWSHLTNLQESSSPQKQNIRRILENTQLKKVFDMDSLKYSRNYEGSLFLEKFNTGAMVESNVVFSEKSFLPRSTMLNMTVDLFGNSLNLFEIGGRVEGLEYLIETYFGPYSYIGGKKSERPMLAELDRLRGEMYVRIFGNEMYYKHFRAADPLAAIKDLSIMDIMAKMAKNQDYSLTQNVMFLDSTMIIPTSAGLPLNLTVNGAATIDIKASGKIDLQRLTSNPSRLSIEGHIRPSAAVEIVGTMYMDAFVTKTGLRVMNTWHSSTELKGRFDMSSGKILNLEIDFPKEKMEVLDVKTAFFNIHGNEAREQKMLSDNKKTLELCTGSRLAEITGLELCNEFQWINASMKEDAPYFPFTGPFSQSLVLYKRDTHTGYTFMAKRSMTRYSTIAKIAVNTPGSRIDRAIAVDYALDRKLGTLEMNLISPWKKTAIKGSFSKNSDKIGMRGSILIDDTREYRVLGEVGIEKLKNVIQYTPRVEFKRSGAQAIILSGSVEMEGMKKITTDLSLTGVRDNAITLIGHLMNGKFERSVKGTVSLGPKQVYVIDAGILYQDTGRKKSIIQITPTLIVRSPGRELISLKGSGEYREGKSIKGDLNLNMYSLLDKPIVVKCDLKQSFGMRNQYTGTVMVNSKLMVVKVNGRISTKKGSASSVVSLDYNFPAIRSIKRDKIDFSSKYTDKSTQSMWNYHINMNFQSKKFPVINCFTDVDLKHTNKHTESEVSLSWGNKIKDSPRHISLYGLVNHDMHDKTNIDYNIKTELGPAGLKVNMKGKHTHDAQNLDSSVIINYGKGKTIDAALELTNTGKRNVNFHGQASLTYPGKTVQVNTALTQNNRDYKHIINVVVDQKKSSIFSNYKREKDSVHRLNSKIDIHNMEPLKIIARTDLNLRDFQVSAESNYAGDVYAVSTMYKITKHPSAKWTVDIMYPDRHVTLLVEGERKGLIYQGTTEIKWDAEKDQLKRFLLNGKLNMKTPGSLSSSITLKCPVQNVEFNIKHNGGKQQTTKADLSWDPQMKVQVETSFKNEMTKFSHIVDGSLRVQTPFENYEDVYMQAGFNNNRKRFTSNGEFELGGKQNQVTYAINMEKPCSMQDFDLTMSGTSPFHGYSRINAAIKHSMEPSLKTVIRGNVDGRTVKLIISGNNRGVEGRRDIEGTVVWKSNIRGMKTAEIRFSHKDNSRTFETEATMDLNGNKYVCVMDMTHVQTGWQIHNNGKLSITSPKTKILTTWKHQNTDKDSKSTLTSTWGSDKRVFVNIIGNLNTLPQTKLNIDMSLQTPWRPIRNIELNLVHEQGTGHLKHHCVVKQASHVRGSIDINFVQANRHIDSNFSLKSPMVDITGTASGRYNQYPLTGHIDMQWGPRSIVSVDGSFSAPSLDNVDATLRLTIPIESMKDIIIDASNKREGSDLVTRSSLNYATSKSIVFESRIDIENLSNFQASLKTPCPYLEAIEGGLEYRGTFDNFNSKAHFAMEPVLGRFASVMNWNIESAISGKLRIETPFKDFKYMQLSVNSEMKGHKRQTIFKVEYYPRNTVSIDTWFSLANPMTMDVVFISPYTNMEHISASMKHTFRRNSVQSHAEIKYGNAKSITGSMITKWSRGLDSNIIVTTPFEGFELSRLSVRRTGSLDDFKAHAEFEFGKKTGESDLEFQHGLKTTGSFTLKIPIPNLEDVKITINRRGSWDKLKSGIIITYGNAQTIDVSVNNRWTNRRLDTAVMIKSPFADDIRFTIDHDGQIMRFTTKCSVSMGSKYAITSDTSVNCRYPSIDMSTRIDYTWNWVGQNMNIKFQQDGYMDDVNMKVIAGYNKEKVQISAMYKQTDDIEGSLRIQTPVASFTDVAMSVRHSGNLNRFTTEGSLKYMDGKTIEGQLTVSQSGWRTVDISYNVKTPFNGYEQITFTHRHSIRATRGAFNTAIEYGYGHRITSDISYEASANPKLNVIVKTPFARMQHNKFVLTHTGPSFVDCITHAEVELWETNINTDIIFQHRQSVRHSAITINTNIKDLEIFKADFSARTADEIHAALVLKTPFNNFRDLSLVVSHINNDNDYVSNAILQYMDDKKIEGVVSFSCNDLRKMNGRMEIKTPFRNFEQIILEHSHNVRNTVLKSNSAVTYSSRQRITCDVAIDMDTGINVMIKTPLKGFEVTKVILTLLRTGGHMEVEAASVEINFDATLENDISTIGKLSLSTNVPGYENTIVMLNIEEGYENFMKTGSIQGSFNLKTPFENFKDIGASLRHGGSLTRFNTELTVQYMDGQTVEGSMSCSVETGTVRAKVLIVTPFRGYERQAVIYRHTINENEVAVLVNVEYGDNKKIELVANGEIAPKVNIEGELTTPFENFKSSRVVFKHEGPVNDCTSYLEIHALGKSIRANSHLESVHVNKGKLDLQTNIEGMKTVTLAYTKDGEGRDMRTSGSVGIEGSVVEVSLHHMLLANRFFTELSIKNPYTEDIKLTCDINGKLTDFKSKLSVSMGPDTDLSSEGSFTLNDMEIDARTNFILKVAGEVNKGSIKFHKEGIVKNMKIELSGELNQDKYSIKVDVAAMKDIHVSVQIETPFRNYRNPGVIFDLFGTADRFTSSAIIRYAEGKEITAKLHHFHKGFQQLESSVELNLPVKGYELLKAELQYTMTDVDINWHGGIQYGSDKINGDINIKLSPQYVFEVELRTPFANYEVLKYSIHVNIERGSYAVVSKLDAGNGNRFTFDFGVDTSSTPITVTMRAQTPFKHFERISMTITHEGELSRFRSTGNLDLPFTTWNGEVAIKYVSPIEMDISIILPENIRFILQNNYRDMKYMAHVEVRWSPTEAIQLDGSYQFVNNWNDNKLTTDFTVITPYEMMRHASVKFEHNQGHDTYSEKIEVDYNEESILDMELELLRGQRDQGSVTFRTPRPMQFILSGELSEQMIDGEMFVNWDRNEPSSNIRVQTTLTDRSESSVLDKDLKVKLIYPTRTWGIAGNLLNNARQTKSRGEFTWNEDAGHKVFYDVDLKDVSRRYSTVYDATIKMGSHHRILMMDGSFSDKRSKKIVDGSFSWDADRDGSKQIGIKAVIIPGEIKKKMDLSLRLPSIGKDIRLDSEFIVNDGLTLFNGKTQLKYSSDSRQTLTIASRLEDTSYGYNNRNYSFVMEIIHPKTHVDVQVRSHAGISDEKYSAGVGIHYLTDRRDRNNFALRGEINRLRKQMEVQILNSLGEMSVVGEIEESPFRINVRGQYGDKSMRTQLTMDSERRSLDFNTNYDLDDPSKTFHMTAKYVNSTAIEALIYHQVNSVRMSDSLLAFRLNTSRLLHTRLSWRPEMIQDLQEFMTRKVQGFGLRSKREVVAISLMVDEEVSRKYNRITREITQELDSVVDLLRSELAQVELELESVRRDMHRLVNENLPVVRSLLDSYAGIIQIIYGDYISFVQNSLADWTNGLSSFLENVDTFRVRDMYREVLDNSVASMKRAMDKVVFRSVDVIARIDEELKMMYGRLRNVKNNIQYSITGIQNHPRLLALKSDIVDKYEGIVKAATDSIDLPKKYNQVVEHVQNILNTNFADVMQNENVKHMISLGNDAYQEGVWAYSYWKVEKNLKVQLQGILTILREVARDQLRPYSQQLEFLHASHVTVWDPEHGEIQIDIYLPIPVKSLESFPDFNAYIPERATISRLYTNVSMYMPNWTSNKTNRIIRKGPRVSTFAPLPPRMS